MARPGLMKHRKFLRLAAMIGSPALARGHLELLWDAAYECGDAYLGDATDVEIVTGWNGEIGVLVQALIQCGGDGPGFIEPVPDRPGRYQIHDLYDHAPDYVRKRRTREQERLSRRADLRSPATDQATVTGQRPVSDRTTADNGCPPAPAPAPTQIKTTPKDASPVTDSVTTPEAVSAPPLLRFHCDGKAGEWYLTPEYVEELADAYPSLDILGECKRALAWIEADRGRRKTAGGMRRFLVGWMNRAQNNGAGRSRGAPPERAPGEPLRGRRGMLLPEA